MGRNCSSAIAAALLCGIAACSDNPPDPPTGPDQVFQGATVAVRSIAVTGATTLTQIGQTAHLTVVATLADGTTNDVTNQATCRVATSVDALAPYVVARPSSGCTITAVAFGLQDIDVAYPATQTWPPAPGTASARVSVSVVPDGAYVLYGRVMQSGYPLAGAHLTVLADAEERAAYADAEGRYMVAPVNGDVTLRARLTGYADQEQRLVVSRHERRDVELLPLQADTTIDGVYRLTIEAAGNCLLPQEVQRRSYPVQIAEVTPPITLPPDPWGFDQPYLEVKVSGGEFVLRRFEVPQFIGAREGATATFSLNNIRNPMLYDFAELIDPSRELIYSGDVTAAVERTQIAGSMNGLVTVLDHFSRQILAQCSAPNHQVTFVR
jgi:hypothetical protein